ncbi:MAG: hypothetical protein JXQ90_16970 [Cyclobacteriaceae bacterium]
MIKYTYKTSISLLVMLTLILGMSACSVSNYSMRNPNYRIDFQAEDFEFSDQVTAEAQSVRVLGVDWKRVFKWNEGSTQSDRFPDQSGYIGNIGTQNVLSGGFDGGLTQILLGSASIPVIGATKKGRVNSYAMYKLMKENPGYDIVIYPQFEQKNFFVPLLYSKRKVTVTARLGRINP